MKTMTFVLKRTATAVTCIAAEIVSRATTEHSLGSLAFGCTICRIGSNVTLLPVKICDDVTIGAGSVVTKDIVEPGIYAGNPTRRIK